MLAKVSFAEFTKDPILSVAALLLIVVSIGWIVVSRLISHELRRAAYRRARKGSRRPPPPRRRSDVWNDPPP